MARREKQQKKQNGHLLKTTLNRDAPKGGENERENGTGGGGVGRARRIARLEGKKGKDRERWKADNGEKLERGLYRKCGRGMGGERSERGENLDK